ncbi:transcriptional adapter ADA2 isoform X1 [Elaeis guineensis]|uniref:transcriptional adapter ADA2 isoform X1 n=1 Tax=Elaeis guineensis var. tenera TaxID=51953 RepID=UPI003C6D5082
MGRSRGETNSTGKDSRQRSKKRRAVPVKEDAETLDAGTKERKYHCNYCNKDISGMIRIKCAICADFDLCVECFSVGAEVSPHKSNHPYRVMDNKSFPLLCSDWNADEEILLLEGIDMYGLGGWAEIAEHVGTKNKAQCIDHYTTAYMNSPSFPLPGMSHVHGAAKTDLLAMDNVQGISVPQNASPKVESLFSSSGLKIGIPSSEPPAERYSSSTSVWTGEDCTNMSSTAANMKAPNMLKFTNGSGGTKLESSTSAEGTHGDTSSGIKKTKDPGDNGLSLSELNGYNPKTQEFDPEYDDDAEKALADMKFMPNDTEIHHELKLRMLHIYCSRLDERKRRKDFILERNLLHTIPLEKELSVEDREVYERYKVFMRYQSPEEHDALVQSVIEEHKLRRRIQELQECRAAGCRTMAEAKAYIEQKKLRELEASMNKTKLDSQVSSSSKILRANELSNKEDGLSDGSPQNINEGNGGSGLELDGKDPSAVATMQVTSKSFDVWDVTGLPGADLLSETERRLCCECKLLPCHYLKIQEVLMTEIYKGTIVKKSDAYSFFKLSKWSKRFLYYLSYLMEPPMGNLLPWNLRKAHSSEVSGGIQSISLRHANFSAFLIRFLSILHFVKATTLVKFYFCNIMATLLLLLI